MSTPEDALVGALAELESLLDVQDDGAARLRPATAMALQMARSSWTVGRLFLEWSRRDADDPNHALDDVIASPFATTTIRSSPPA